MLQCTFWSLLQGCGAGPLLQSKVQEFGWDVASIDSFFFFLSNGRCSLSQWRQLSQVALSGSRSDGGGCHGSRGAWTLSGCDAAHTLFLSHAHTVGSILDCRIINRKQQKAAPLSSFPTPMGPHHSHILLHPFLPNTYLYFLSSVALFIPLF